MARHAVAEHAPDAPAEPDKRRTIAIVTPGYEDLGGLRSVAEFIRRAVESRPGFEARMVSIATAWRDPCNQLLSRPSSWRPGPLSEARRMDGQAYVHVGARFGEFEFARYGPNPLLRRVLGECDLIQVVAGAPAWAWPVIGLGKPVSLHAATLTVVERRKRASEERGPLALWRRAMTGLARRADQAALRAADAIQVDNRWMLEHAGRAASGAAPVQYAPPGVDAVRFRPLRLGESPGGRPYILAVGRFSDPRKNLGLLLRAYVRLTERLPAAPDLVLAGATEASPGFWAQVAARGLGGRVTLRHNPDAETLAGLYRRALCLALSSDEEGFGVVVIEAMASGIPVVSTRCGGPDGIITDGEDGFLVERDDDERFAARLEAIVADPGMALGVGAAARRTAERRFAEPVAARCYLELYERLLAPSFRQRAEA